VGHYRMQISGLVFSKTAVAGCPTFRDFRNVGFHVFSLVGIFGLLASPVWCEGWLFGRRISKKNLLWTVDFAVLHSTYT